MSPYPPSFFVPLKIGVNISFFGGGGGSIVKGSVNFLFLPDRRCSIAACGGSISNVSYNVFDSFFLLLGCAVRVIQPSPPDLVLVSFMCGGRAQNDVCCVSNSFVRLFPVSQKMCCYCRL